MAPTYRDRAVAFEETLVLADLHLGREATSAAQLSVGTESDVVDRVETLLSTCSPEVVVFAGDVLHSFESVPRSVEVAVANLRETVRDADARAVVLRGNHDAQLSRVWDGTIRETYRIGETVVCHGHERPDVDAERYVVGHDHPTLRVEGQKRPCYLRGPAVGGGELLMVPAFDLLAGGAAVNEMSTDDFRSPLVADADALRPIVRDSEAEETLEFPRLGRFRELL